MGNIFLVSIEILILGILLINISFLSLVICTLIFLLQLLFILKINKIIYYIIPLLFLTQSFFIVNFNNFNKTDIINFKVNIVDSRGKIETISNKYPIKNMFITTENIANGKYRITGQILDISKDNLFYNIKILEKEKISLNHLQDFFLKKFNYFKEYINFETSNLLRGTILGEKRYIYYDIRKSFIYCGASHLLAISGLHLGLIFSSIFFILNLFEIKRNIKYTLSFIFITIYFIGINISSSLIRAYIMINTFVCGEILYEKINFKKSFSFSIILNLLLFPTSCNNLSFIFSYASLFSILYIYPKYKIKDENKKYRKIFNFLIFLASIQLFLTPINLYFFNFIPLFSYFTSFIITLLGTIFITFGGISFFLPNIIFRFFTSYILDNIYFIIKFFLLLFSNIPYLTIKLKDKPPLNFIIFIYIIYITLFYRKKINEYLKIILWRRRNDKENDNIC